MENTAKTYIVSYEPTPNPATMKFNISATIADKTAEFKSAQDCDSSPLASKLFGFPWTSAIFVGTNFVTVTKQDWVDWSVLAEPLTGLIKEHFEAGLPALVELAPQLNDENANDSKEVKTIKHILNSEIRPAVALDGGDIVFSKYEDNVVYLHMKGACAGCPSSSATLKDGVEVRLKEALPEIREVVSI